MMAHLIRVYGNNDLKELISSNRLLAGVFVCAIQKSFSFMEEENILAFPEEFRDYLSYCKANIRFFKNIEYIPASINGEYKNSTHFTISNGRFITNIEKKFLKEILNIFKEDILMINVTPELLSYRESIRFNSNSDVVAFRRYCCDSIKPAPIPSDWPCHIFIRKHILDQIPVFPNNFYDFINICNDKSLKTRSLNVGGSLLDLKNKNHVLQLLINPCVLKDIRHLNNGYIHKKNQLFYNDNKQNRIKIFGEVLFGENVSIDNNAVVVGPAIICKNVKISSQSVIQNSIIYPDISIPAGCQIINSIIESPQQLSRQFPELSQGNFSSDAHGYCLEMREMSYESRVSNFRAWPAFSYPRFLKRANDILFSTLVLIILFPLLFLISIMIKATSPGPIFYKDRRQGRHGREFNCIKFRTMIVGAERIQDKLRNINEVDGPQFKIDNDPRVTKLGKFLRDTYIDEIPQFINVLLGQMSLVGPRPSPRKENSLCPAWRDARLSVRPGITGLWQACRTRALGQDFQEWIHYDIEYVRNISFLLDIKICLKTIMQIISKFLKIFSKK